MVGETSGSAETRISGAERSTTNLLAGVEVVVTSEVYGVNCQKLDTLIHKVLFAAHYNLAIRCWFGHVVKPCAWFLVPLNVIHEALGL